MNRLILLCLILLSAFSRKPAHAQTLSLFNTGSDFAITRASNLLIRSQPSRSGAIVTKIPRGTILKVNAAAGNTETIEGITGQWYSIETDSGRTGFAFGGFLKMGRFGDEFPEDRTDIFEMECLGRYEDCIEKTESRLRSTYGFLSRHGNTLEVRCAGGKTQKYESVHLDDYSDEVEQWTATHYFEKQQALTLELALYEGWRLYWLETQTCREEELLSYPLFSPREEHFAAFAQCEAFCVNGIQVFRTGEGGITKVYELLLDNLPWRATNLKWESETKLNFIRYYPYYTWQGQTGVMQFNCSLSYNGKEWVIEY